MSEEVWIRSNIKQRKCTVFCRLDDDHPRGCKCYHARGSHVNPDSSTEVWTLSKNTVTEPCSNFGTVHVGNETCKFVRIDVETDTSTTETLLLDVWKLSKPKWILSVMGDVYGDVASKANELQTLIRSVLNCFSNGQNIWITSEGLNFGVAQIVGKALEDPPDEYKWTVTPVGIFAWGGCDDKCIQSLLGDKILPEGTGGNSPSVLYPHHLLVDDGTENPSFVHQSFQNFRMKLETSLANHNDASSSIPLVTLLYGGWAYVIDGVKTAIENNIPIVVLKGTGGFADILANVFEVSKEDKSSVTANESSEIWTGTVIDDVLRKEVEAQFKAVHGKPYKAGQHIILQCLQKRELITVVDVDDQENTLTNAIIKALLKSKRLSEVLRILDYYMPTPMFDGDSAASAAIKVMEQKEKSLNNTTGLFLLQSMLMDRSEYVQFIIDYEGVDLVGFTRNRSNVFQTIPTEADLFPSWSQKKISSTDEVFQVLLIWAVRTRKPNCAALFWKKGKHLLAAALVCSLVLQTMKESEENIGDKKILEQHAFLFENRAIGVINECYDNEKEKTMALIQAQARENIWKTNVLDCCLTDRNRRIFATEAFKKYTKRVWYGEINPPYQNTYKTPALLKSNKDSRPSVFKRTATVIKRTAPVTTYTVNLIFYIGFLSLFGHTLLFELGPKYSVLEGILVVWWLTFVWEEVRQFLTRRVLAQAHFYGTDCTTRYCGYFRDNFWNILDFFCLLFFLIGGILMAVFHVNSSGSTHSEDELLTAPVYQAARVFLSLDVMIFTWRILQHLAIFSIMGPLLEMIYQMVKDLFPFLVIMFIFIISQGLAAHALLYPSRDWSPEAFLDIPKSAFWNVFGELGLEDIEASEAQEQCSSNPLLFENDTKNECPSTLGKYFVPFLLGMYMLLMNVLLLNLLIAKFSYTFGKVHDQTEWLAAWQRARVTLEYFDKPPLAPPLNIFFDIMYFIYKCTCGKRNKVGNSDNPPDKSGEEQREEEEMSSWERSMAECYLASAEFKSGSERMSIIRENKEKSQETSVLKMLQNISHQPSNSDESNRSSSHSVYATRDTHHRELVQMIQGLSNRIGVLENSVKVSMNTQTEIRKQLEERRSTMIHKEPSAREIITLDDVEENTISSV